MYLQNYWLNEIYILFDSEKCLFKRFILFILYNFCRQKKNNLISRFFMKILTKRIPHLKINYDFWILSNKKINSQKNIKYWIINIRSKSKLNKITAHNGRVRPMVKLKTQWINKRNNKRLHKRHACKYIVASCVYESIMWISTKLHADNAFFLTVHESTGTTKTEMSAVRAQKFLTQECVRSH